MDLEVFSALSTTTEISVVSGLAYKALLLMFISLGTSVWMWKSLIH